MTMREKIARAMCRARGKDPDTVNTQGVVRWTLYLPETDAVLEALAEPSEGMVEKGQEAYEPSCEYWLSDFDIAAVFTAMIQAAKEGK